MSCQSLLGSHRASCGGGVQTLGLLPHPVSSESPPQPRTPFLRLGPKPAWVTQQEAPGGTSCGWIPSKDVLSP